MRAAWAARQERLPRDHGRLVVLDARITERDNPFSGVTYVVNVVPVT